MARQYGHALALTSANQSGSASTLDLSEFTELWDDVSAHLKILSTISLNLNVLVRFHF